MLHRGADILILDEPTAVLTAQEIAELFKVLRALTAEGVSVIFITHKLREVLEIADRVTVLRRGKKIDTVADRGRDRGEPRQADGRPRRAVPRREGAGASGRAGARASRTSQVEDDRGLPARRGLSLTGPRRRDRRRRRRRRQRADPSWSRRSPACASRRAARSASPARDITGAGVRGALAAGVGHIAEDRHRRGLVLDFTLAENLALREYRRAPLRRFGLLSPRRMDAAGAAAARAVRRPRRPAQTTAARRCRAATSRRS